MVSSARTWQRSTVTPPAPANRRARRAARDPARRGAAPRRRSHRPPNHPNRPQHRLDPPRRAGARVGYRGGVHHVARRAHPLHPTGERGRRGRLLPRLCVRSTCAAPSSGRADVTGWGRGAAGAAATLHVLGKGCKAHTVTRAVVRSERVLTRTTDRRVPVCLLCAATVALGWTRPDHASRPPPPRRWGPTGCARIGAGDVRVRRWPSPPRPGCHCRLGQ